MASETGRSGLSRARKEEEWGVRWVLCVCVCVSLAVEVAVCPKMLLREVAKVLWDSSEPTMVTARAEVQGVQGKGIGEIVRWYIK